MAPGLLYVTMQPHASLSAAQFHDWYNNEHGPLRLQLPFFRNGFRYRDTDGDANSPSPYDSTKPEWLALYDVDDAADLTRPPYTTLREQTVQSEREIQTFNQVTMNRQFYDFVREWTAADYKHLEDLDADAEGTVLVAVCFKIKPGTEAELDRWYNEEHVELLTKVPGWRRTRRFVTASVLNPTPETKEYLSLHEYAPQNGLGGPEFQAAVSTPFAKHIYEDVVVERKRRVYQWFYTFGPAPRDLKSLSTPGYNGLFVSRDEKTRTYAASQTPSLRSAIESYVTTADGVDIQYRLEGSKDPEAPLIVLINSILSDWGIWDEFLDLFFASPQNLKYRVLRYRPRGRADDGGQIPVTLDLLTQDAIALLDALRVRKAVAIIGVSLGGATALNAALKYPSRLNAFISCDTSSTTPPGATEAWAERIALAENDDSAPKDKTGARLVGEKLAEATVRRWFPPDNFDGGVRQARVQKVKEYVRTNNLEGFKRSVVALYDYDLREAMKTATVRGTFVVGSGDGVLPTSMKTMAAEYGAGASLTVIDDAGHLPMTEQPSRFVEVVNDFLRST